MAQQLTILGWLDPDWPARWKDTGPCEFRLKLSETPGSAWKDRFAELGKQNNSGETIERDVLLLPCELGQVESAMARLKERVQQTNLAVGRQERDVADRDALYKRGEEERRKAILAAVSRIRFQNAPE